VHTISRSLAVMQQASATAAAASLHSREHSMVAVCKLLQRQLAQSMLSCTSSRTVPHGHAQYTTLVTGAVPQ
jgi:hypothetical protein